LGTVIVMPLFTSASSASHLPLALPHTYSRPRHTRFTTNRMSLRSPFEGPPILPLPSQLADYDHVWAELLFTCLLRFICAPLVLRHLRCTLAKVSAHFRLKRSLSTHPLIHPSCAHPGLSAHQAHSGAKHATKPIPMIPEQVLGKYLTVQMIVAKRGGALPRPHMRLCGPPSGLARSRDMPQSPRKSGQGRHGPPCCLGSYCRVSGAHMCYGGR
jgi:hypothetical protein